MQYPLYTTLRAGREYSKIWPARAELNSLFTVLQLEKGFTYGLLITACFPGYEGVRDLLRLKQLA